MYNYRNCAILYNAKRRRSILVGTAASERGPKNPLKGISVKPLVPAYYAQFWVGAGGKRVNTLADSGRFPMAWMTRPCFRGDLFLCADVLPSWYFRPAYEADCEPARRCERAVSPQALCADVACLAWVWWMRGQAVSAPAGATGGPLLPETTSAKEAKRRTDRSGNHLGCSPEAGKGLQCGLSGSRVARRATPRRNAERETAPIGNEGCVPGKTNPYLSRKIYFSCRRPLSILDH